MLVQTLRERMLLARHTPEDEKTTVQHHLTPLIKNKTYFPNLGVKFPQNAAKRKINYIYIINIQCTALYFEARVAVALFRKSFQVGMMRRNCCSQSYSCCHCSQTARSSEDLVLWNVSGGAGMTAQLSWKCSHTVHGAQECVRYHMAAGAQTTE